MLPGAIMLTMNREGRCILPGINAGDEGATAAGNHSTPRKNTRDPHTEKHMELFNRISISYFIYFPNYMHIAH